MERIQKQAILNDLQKKMVFIVGPRQAGKTWLAKELIGREFKNTVYLNFDSSEDRKIIIETSWLPDTELLILDELHKMPDWKNHLKGVYDTKPKLMKIIVTGSARLDAFREAGDALTGRFYLHHLLPLSAAELFQLHLPVDLERLMIHSGFPEPYLDDNELEVKRWRMQYVDSVLREEIFDFENIQNIKAIKMILELLRERVGSPISYTSLAEDVQISPNTVKKYIQILESLYIVFRVTPFSKNIARSLLKEPKIYFFDTCLVKGNHGKRFENLVALSLLKHAYAKRDYEALEYKLQYLRTKEQKEVDFVLVREGEIEKMIEAKVTDKELNPSLIYFRDKYHLQGVQVVKELRQERIEKGISIIKAAAFLENLAL